MEASYEGRLVFGTHDGFESSGTGVLTNISRDFESILDSVRTVRVSPGSWFFFSIPFMHSRSSYRLYAFATYANDKLKRDGYWGAGAAFHENDDAELSPNTLFTLEEWADEKIAQLGVDPSARHEQMLTSNRRSQSKARSISTPSLFHLTDHKRFDRELFFRFVPMSNLSRDFPYAKRGYIVSAKPLPNSLELDVRLMNSVLTETKALSENITPNVKSIKFRIEVNFSKMEQKVRDLERSAEEMLYTDYMSRVSGINELSKNLLHSYERRELNPLMDNIQYLEKIFGSDRKVGRAQHKAAKKISAIEDHLNSIKRIEDAYLTELRQEIESLSPRVTATSRQKQGFQHEPMKKPYIFPSVLADRTEDHANTNSELWVGGAVAFILLSIFCGLCLLVFGLI